MYIIYIYILYKHYIYIKGRTNAPNRRTRVCCVSPCRYYWFVRPHHAFARRNDSRREGDGASGHENPAADRRSHNL